MSRRITSVRFHTAGSLMQRLPDQPELQLFQLAQAP